MLKMGTIVDDDYDHIDELIEYTPENILCVDVCSSSDNKEYKNLQDQFNSVLLNSCKCNREEDDCATCCHGGNYTLNKESGIELVLKSNCNDVLYECSSICKCNPKKCLNRLVQKGPNKHLKIVDSVQYGSKGLITTRDIPEGTFICEYAGELLTKNEFHVRSSDNANTGRMNYILCLREYNLKDVDASSECTTIIDPSRKGNIGRYLNHSCSPNCKIVSVRTDCPIPKIAIFAKQRIKAGEELCFHYSDGVSAKILPKTNGASRIPCLCQSKNCMGYLPNIDL